MSIEPIKITINGHFWDVYLYKNLLYIFLSDNKEIKIIDWDKFVNSCIEDEKIRIAFKCAFLNGDYLYKEVKNHIFDDDDFKKLLFEKFQLTHDIEVNLDSEKFTNSLYNSKKIKLLYPFYFSEIDVYNKKIYISGESGVYFSNINDKRYKRKPQLDFRLIEETKELNICSMKIAKNKLYLSTQDNGLYEYDNFKAQNHYDQRALKKISQNHSSFINTNYSSILSSSYITTDEFIHRSYEKEIDDSLTIKDRNSYNIREIFTDDNDSGFYFSKNERIYQILDGKINYCFFNQSKNEKDEIFHNKKQVEPAYHFDTSKIINASVETFGVVIEFENKIVVLSSDGKVYEFPGNDGNRIVEYRTYPRSNCYTNQLHIIYENKLEIISFNHDYFEDQIKKDFGVRFVINKDDE